MGLSEISVSEAACALKVILQISALYLEILTCGLSVIALKQTGPRDAWNKNSEIGKCQGWLGDTLSPCMFPLRLAIEGGNTSEYRSPRKAYFFGAQLWQLVCMLSVSEGWTSSWALFCPSQAKGCHLPPRNFQGPEAVQFGCGWVFASFQNYVVVVNCSPPSACLL